MEKGITSVIGPVTKHMVSQAFVKAAELTKITEEGHLVLITEDLYDVTQAFMRDNFLAYEPLHVALGCDKEFTNWEKSLMHTLKLNMSIAMLNKSTEEIVGLVVLGIGHAGEEYDLDQFTNDGIKHLLRIIAQCTKGGNLFQHYNTTEVINIQNLVVGEKYRQRGIASHLVEFTVNFVTNIGVYPIYIKAIATSCFAKRCFEKHGFEELFEVPYSTYKVDGKEIVCNTGVHKSMFMFGKCIENT